MQKHTLTVHSERMNEWYGKGTLHPACVDTPVTGLQCGLLLRICQKWELSDCITHHAAAAAAGAGATARSRLATIVQIRPTPFPPGSESNAARAATQICRVTTFFPACVSACFAFALVCGRFSAPVPGLARSSRRACWIYGDDGRLSIGVGMFFFFCCSS